MDRILRYLKHINNSQVAKEIDLFEARCYRAGIKDVRKKSIIHLRGELRAKENEKKSRGN